MVHKMSVLGNNHCFLQKKETKSLNDTKIYNYPEFSKKTKHSHSFSTKNTKNGKTMNETKGKTARTKK